MDQFTAETCKNRNHKELQCTRRKVERGKLIYPRYLFASHHIKYSKELKTQATLFLGVLILRPKVLSRPVGTEWANLVI